jgi:hypothetical protein
VPTFTITWDLFLRVGSDRAADTVLRRLAKDLGRELAVVRRERYRKDPALVRVAATTPLGTDDPAAAVFQALLLARAIAIRWTVGSPQAFAGDRWELDGWSEGRCRAVGVDSAAFEVRNFEHEVWQPDGQEVQPD